MSNRYQSSKIYRIVFNDGKYYIGSTTQELNIRMNVHKTRSKTHATNLYEHVRKIGWDNAKIILIEDCLCKSKDELNNKEKEHRIKVKSDPLCLNDNSDIEGIEETDPNNTTIYKSGKIYRLICDDGHYYIGSTVSELPFRLNNHKQLSRTKKDPLYVYINSIGWDKVKIELIKKIQCHSKGELEQLKAEYIHTLPHSLLCLNSVIDNSVNTESTIDEEETNNVTVYDKEPIDEESDTHVNETYRNSKIYRILCKDGHYYYGSTTTTLEKRFTCHKHSIVNKLGSDKYSYLYTIPLNDITIELVENVPCNSKQELREHENRYILEHKNHPLCLNTYQSYQSEDDKKKYAKQYHEFNKVEHKERMKEYYEENKDVILAHSTQYREENRDEILERKAQYREKNREVLREKQKEYAKQNLESVHKARKKYYEEHKEEHAEYYREYRKMHRQEISAKQLEWSKKKKEENAEQIAKEREAKLQKRKEKSDARIKKDCDVHTCECGGTYQLYRKSRHDSSKKHTDFVKIHT